MPPATVSTLFLSWSGDDSGTIAAAFRGLLRDVFGASLEPWLSRENITALSPWRREIQDAVKSSKGAVLVLGARSLESKWLFYEAGAFFREGTTFILGCGVDDVDFKNSPLSELQVWDAGDAAKVKRLLESIGTVADSRPSDFDARFDAAWKAFERVVREVRDAVQARAAEEEANARHERRKRTLTLAGLAAIVALGLGGWFFWREVSCAVSSGRAAADCGWRRFIAEHKASGAKATENLDQMVSRRPFAVIRMTPVDGAGASRVLIVRQGSEDKGVAVTAVFAKSGSETADFAKSILTLRSGASWHVVEVSKDLTIGSHRLSLLHVDSLSDNRICDKVATLRKHFPDSTTLAEQLTAFLTDFHLGGGDELRRRIEAWIADCASS